MPSARNADTLLGPLTRAKILRFFSVQPEGRWATERELALRLRLSPSAIRREVGQLVAWDVCKSRRVGIARPLRRRASRLRRERKRGKRQTRRRTQEVFFLNETFPALAELKLVILRSFPFLSRNLLRALRASGRIKLLLFTGALVGESSLPTDILIVGEGIRRQALQRALDGVEREAGLDLRYTVLSSEEFQERRAMHDRFLRDVLESPQQRVIDTLPRSGVPPSPHTERRETLRLPLS